MSFFAPAAGGHNAGRDHAQADHARCHFRARTFNHNRRTNHQDDRNGARPGSPGRPGAGRGAPPPELSYAHRPISPGPVLINEIIKRQELTVISGERVERLKAALQPVLAYHKRDGKLPIFVVRSEQPKAFVAVRAALIITTKLMLITSEAELRGIVAHELAHEYLWEERDRAFKEKDESTLREIELFCDAVAAITLKEIGDDPVSLRAGAGADDLHRHYNWQRRHEAKRKRILRWMRA